MTDKPEGQLRSMADGEAWFRFPEDKMKCSLEQGTIIMRHRFSDVTAEKNVLKAQGLSTGRMNPGMAGKRWASFLK